MFNNWYEQLNKYLRKSSLNRISSEKALKTEYINLKIFGDPIWACADPQDILFKNLKSEVIGQHFKLPLEWNSNAKTVISLFFPFTDDIIISNNMDKKYPSNLWLHGRIEGQECIDDMANFVVNFFELDGYKTVSPSLSDNFFSVSKGETLSFTSNWSERHVAYICGLGTFGLSKGLITDKGMAGRFMSVITQADFEKSTRRYNSVYEYCTMCNACAKRCPANAISLEHGKNHIICSDFLDITVEKFKPRYGCGKCQTDVPCSQKIPNKAGPSG